jgi:hypothetical protein
VVVENILAHRFPRVVEELLEKVAQELEPQVILMVVAVAAGMEVELVQKLNMLAQVEVLVMYIHLLRLLIILLAVC